MSRLHRRPLRILINEIVNGERSEGELLPGEVELAAHFDMSRGTAREVIRGLEERGLISVKHGRGATINESDDWNTFDSDVLAAILAGPSSASVLRELLECRRIFEIEAAALAAERADADDISALKEAFERMEERAERSVTSADEEELYHQADTAFHLAVIRAAKNVPLASIASRIHAAMVTARYPLARPQARLATNVPEHGRVLAAIEQKDPIVARLAMTAHLDTVEKYLDEFEESGGTLVFRHRADDF